MQDARTEEPPRTTLLELVQQLTDSALQEREVVAQAASLVNRGEVILTGNFRGQRLEVEAC